MLSWALQKAGNGEGIRFPVEYVELLRGCIERTTLSIRQVKPESGTSDDIPGKRFTALVEALRAVPPLEIAIAETIGLVADSYRGNVTPIEGKKLAGDVCSHFVVSSSFATKGSSPEHGGSIQSERWSGWR